MKFPNLILEDRLSSHYPVFEISSHRKLLKGKFESVNTVWRVFTRRIALTFPVAFILHHRWKMYGTNSLQTRQKCLVMECV